MEAQTSRRRSQREYKWVSQTLEGPNAAQGRFMEGYLYPVRRRTQPPAAGQSHLLFCSAACWQCRTHPAC